MDNEGSLYCSNKSTSCPYPEPDKSSSRLNSYLLKIHLNIIFLSKPRSSKLSLSLTLFHRNPVQTSHLSYTCHMPSPSSFSWFYRPNNIRREVQIIKLLAVKSSPVLCYCVPPQHSRTPSACTLF